MHSMLGIAAKQSPKSTLFICSCDRQTLAPSLSLSLSLSPCQWSLRANRLLTVLDWNFQSLKFRLKLLELPGWSCQTRTWRVGFLRTSRRCVTVCYRLQLLERALSNFDLNRWKPPGNPWNLWQATNIQLTNC